MTAQVNFVPEGTFANKDLERMLIELSRLIPQKEVMRADEAAAFLSVSVRNLDRMVAFGKLPCHRIEGLRGKLFLRTELIDFIKRH